IAAGDLEGAPRLGEYALLDVFHPGSGDAEGHFVLGLAGHRARVAADAPPIVDQEGVVQAARFYVRPGMRPSPLLPAVVAAVAAVSTVAATMAAVAPVLAAAASLAAAA